MKKPNTFIRQLNLKFCRKLRAIPLSEAGKRFVLDGNAHRFEAESENTSSDQWGLMITKNHGKYTIIHWASDWDAPYWVRERITVTSDDRKVIKLIDGAVDDGYEAFWFKDKQLNNLKWHVLRDVNDLYDDNVEIDLGAVPEDFEPVNELEPVPEEIAV